MNAVDEDAAIATYHKKFGKGIDTIEIVYEPEELNDYEKTLLCLSDNEKKQYDEVMSIKLSEGLSFDDAHSLSLKIILCGISGCFLRKKERMLIY